MSTPKETLRQSPLQQVELILQPESMPEEARANPDNRVPLGWLLVHKKYDARKRLNLTDLSEQSLKEFAVLHPMCQEIFFGPQIGFQRDYRYMRRFKGDWEGWSTHHSLGSTPPRIWRSGTPGPEQTFGPLVQLAHVAYRGRPDASFELNVYRHIPGRPPSTFGFQKALRGQAYSHDLDAQVVDHLPLAIPLMEQASRVKHQDPLATRPATPLRMGVTLVSEGSPKGFQLHVHGTLNYDLDEALLSAAIREEIQKPEYSLQSARPTKARRQP